MVHGRRSPQQPSATSQALLFPVRLNWRSVFRDLTGSNDLIGASPAYSLVLVSPNICDKYARTCDLRRSISKQMANIWAHSPCTRRSFAAPSAFGRFCCKVAMSKSASWEGRTLKGISSCDSCLALTCGFIQ